MSNNDYVVIIGSGAGGGDADQYLHHARSNAATKVEQSHSLGRMARPKEIASRVAFLAGDGASYMTATTIFANGGIMQSSPGL